MLEGLSWIAATYKGVYCVTFARGLEEQEMLGRFVGDPSRAWLIPDLVEDEELREELEALEEEGPIVQVGSCEGWSFALEGGASWEGTRPEVLWRVSQGTVAVSLYRNVNAVTRFSYAVNGVVVAWFDPLCQYGSDNWDKDAGLLPWFQQAGLDPRDHWFKSGKQPLEVMSDLAETIGVRLDREAVAEEPLFRTWITQPDGTY
jgi:hypothetical protein